MNNVIEHLIRRIHDATEIKSVDDFIACASHGLCGNTPRMWATLQDYLRDPVKGTLYRGGKVTSELTITTKTSSKHKYYRVRNLSYIEHLAKNGPKDLFAMEFPSLTGIAPMFQFDYFPVDDCYLRCAISPDPWGKCKREGLVFDARGLSAQLILRSHLGHYKSELDEVVERWPEHVIEGTLFPFNVGRLRKRLQINEVRKF